MFGTLLSFRVASCVSWLSSLGRIAALSRHVADNSGTVWQMKLPKSNGEADLFVRVKAAADSPERLAEYFGTYYGEEFDANYKIAPKRKGLTLHMGL